MIPAESVMQLPSVFHIHVMNEEQFPLSFSILLVHRPGAATAAAAGTAGTGTGAGTICSGAVAVCVPRCHQQLGSSRHGGYFALEGLIADPDRAQLGVLGGGREVLDHATHCRHRHLASLLLRLTWKEKRKRDCIGRKQACKIIYTTSS